MADSPQVRSRRTRRRKVQSCAECRRRKVRCDRAKPCGQCIANQTADTCVYHGSNSGSPSIQSAILHEHDFRDEHEDVNRIAGNTPTTRESLVTLPSSTNGFHGTVLKTRVFGQGHWMNAFSMPYKHTFLEPFGEVYQATFTPSEDSDRTRIVSECKSLARQIKRTRSSRCQVVSQVHNSLPNCEVMRSLIEIYFRTFECCYRIFDHELFVEEYEKRKVLPSEMLDSSYVLQLALIASLAGPIQHDPAIRSEIAHKAEDWLHTAQTWLSAPFEKDRLRISGVQVHCLVLLARQANKVGADLVWISAGTLIRTAMQMGLHQDPDSLGIASAKHRELLRGLWYTIMELNVQAALDAGMPPMISEGDYNTRPPTDDFGDEPNTSPGLSLQPLLARSIPLRVQIVRNINSMQAETSHEKILELSQELDVAFRKVSSAAALSLPSIEDRIPTSNSHFAFSLCSHLLQRISLSLHFRYALQAAMNLLYRASLSAALDAALNIVALLDDPSYRPLLLAGGGMFRDIITRCATIIFLSLDPQRPDNGGGNSSSSHISVFARQRHRARQAPIVEEARRVVQYARERVAHGDTNIKTYVCLATMLAHVEASGTEARAKMFAAADESIGVCHGILQGMAAEAAATTSSSHRDGRAANHDLLLSPNDLGTAFDIWDDNDLDFMFPDFQHV